MSTRATYCAIFGLKENASKDEIRKAYRKLAMKYHPDKNPDPKAHQVFVDLAEAYEILLNDKFQENSKLKTKEKSFEQRKKEAEKRFEKQQKREQKEQDLYYKNLTSGKKWKLFKHFAKICAFFSFLVIFEMFLPRHIEQHRIESYSPKYNGLILGQVISFKTDKSLTLFINNPPTTFLYTNPDIIIERTWFFYNPTKIWSKASYINRPFYPDFSVISLFPLVPLLFLIPLGTIYFRKKSLQFTFFYYLSIYFIGIMAVYFFFAQERWFHLITLGFL